MNTERNQMYITCFLLTLMFIRLDWLESGVYGTGSQYVFAVIGTLAMILTSEAYEKEK